MVENCSEQVGIVVDVKPKEVVVKIEQKSTCANCHSRGACTSFDKKDKEIEVVTDKAADYKIGDKVKVSISTKLGMKAVFIAFVLPFVFLMIAIVVCLKCLNLSEALSCLIAIVITAVYYYVLFKRKNSLQKQFVFKIHHCSE
ncbi:MAG: SoxR reducing system RseC family protein [Bacteroidales bacterium]|nr:SoxR reducing system RseC family protein [Bacteroidales bacterium]